MIKAMSRTGGEHKHVPKEEPRTQETEETPEADAGDVVVVLFPRDTWNTVQEMATRAGVSNPAILSTALELLHDKMKAE